jgi:hypothetical protein
LSRIAPPRPSSIYAATGTLAHKYIEDAVDEALRHGMLPGEMPLSQEELGRVWEIEGHRIEIDQDFIAGVNVMLLYVHDVLRPGCAAKFELRVSLDSYFAEPPPVPLFGSVDAAIYELEHGILEIIDYKNGAGIPVSPKNNPQLLYYAAGVVAGLPKELRDKIAEIRLTIIQPHVAPLERRSWTITLLDLEMWIEEVLKPGVEACAQPDAPLNPGSWCRFCPAVQICPRLAKDAQAMAKQEFDDVAMPDPDVMAADILRDPAALAEALDVAERAMLWSERVREYALETLKQQVRIPGWQLAPTRPTRKWAGSESATARVLTDSGIADEVLWEQTLRSPAQMEKALKRVQCHHLWAAIADTLVESVSSGVKLERSDLAELGDE